MKSLYTIILLLFCLKIEVIAQNKSEKPVKHLSHSDWKKSGKPIEMIKEARIKAKWAPNVNIKIPITPDGLTATSVLSEEGIDVNMTLCFSANQALLGALAGAAYVSIFVGRLDDVGQDGMQVVEDTIKILANYPDLEAQVIAASIRNPMHVTYAAMAGADVATVPYAVLMQMIQHPLTDAGIKRFLDDWKKVANK